MTIQRGPITLDPLAFSTVPRITTSDSTILTAKRQDFLQASLETLRKRGSIRSPRMAAGSALPTNIGWPPSFHRKAAASLLSSADRKAAAIKPTLQRILFPSVLVRR